MGGILLDEFYHKKVYVGLYRREERTMPAYNVTSNTDIYHIFWERCMWYACFSRLKEQLIHFSFFNAKLTKAILDLEVKLEQSWPMASTLVFS